MSQIIGILGLICIIAGVLLRHRKKRDIIYIIGGLLLTYYSYTLGDTIFLTLQVVFVLVAMYDLGQKRR